MRNFKLQSENVSFTKNNKSNTRPILILGSMQCEYDYLVDLLANVQIDKYGNFTYFKGTLDNKFVIVCNCLMGQINAASATQYAIDRYNPEIVIMQGTSGGHHSNIHQGDIILGKDLIDIGAYYSNHADKGMGFNIKDHFNPGVEMKDKDGNVYREVKMHSDNNIMRIAKTIPNKYGNVIEGVIGTADQWNKEIDLINHIHSVLNTDCEEMEGFAVGQVCQNANIKFIAIRIVSNNEINNEQFDIKYGQYCQEFVSNLIKNYR